MASDTASKRNGRTWLFSVSGALFAALAMGSFGLLWTMSQDVSAIAASMEAMSDRADRSDVRWSRAFDQLDSRLRDVELGER